MNKNNVKKNKYTDNKLLRHERGRGLGDTEHSKAIYCRKSLVMKGKEGGTAAQESGMEDFVE